MVDPETIYNWRCLDDRITTSGQPTKQQLSACGTSSISGSTPTKGATERGRERCPPRNDLYPHPGRFSEPDRPGLRSVLRRHGTAKGCPCPGPLHRERSGLCLLLPLPPRRTGHRRDTGTCRDGRGLATKCHLGGICGTAKREARSMTIGINGMAHVTACFVLPSQGRYRQSLG